jgi:DNA mismatch repair protein MutS2
MNEKALKTLEYDKIIDMLSQRATSPAGRQRCETLTPSDNLNTIRRMQNETSDALARLERSGSISFGSAKLMGALLNVWKSEAPCLWRSFFLSQIF